VHYNKTRGGGRPCHFGHTIIDERALIELMNCAQSTAHIEIINTNN
jgi:hypothetical protein